MMRIIINADDCGYSSKVNNEIEHCIVGNKITSTTIMANMEDYDGAIKLYNKYKNEISFGWHINLTEGTPLRYSQKLLDCGFYIESGGRVLFNGKKYWRRIPSRSVWDDIKKELDEQYMKISDNNVVISHVDSHHHVHTCPGLFLLFLNYFGERKIESCRRIRNYVPSSTKRMIRNLWAVPFKMKGISMPDTLSSFKGFVDNPSLPHGQTIELMCHPGHPSAKYIEEYELLKKTDLNTLYAKLITYDELLNNK